MLQNKITSELQRIALFCTNNFMKLWLWLWIPFCQFTVHMLYVLLSLLHCKFASIVSQMWIVTQNDDALKLLQSQFQQNDDMHWSCSKDLESNTKGWCTEVCGKDLDSNTNSDGCTAQAVAQIWIPTQNVMWWMHKLKFAAKIWILTQKVMDSHLKLQQRAGHNTKRVCIVWGCSKDLDSCTKGDRCTAQVPEKIWIAIPGLCTEVYCLLL